MPRESGKRKYTCSNESCAMEFTSKGILEHHYRKKHQDRVVVNFENGCKASYSRSNSDGMFYCECRRPLKTPITLRRHALVCDAAIQAHSSMQDTSSEDEQWMDPSPCTESPFDKAALLEAFKNRYNGTVVQDVNPRSLNRFFEIVKWQE